MKPQENEAKENRNWGKSDSKNNAVKPTASRKHYLKFTVFTEI